MRKKRICMIVQNPRVKGGIAAVTSGYYNSQLDQEYEVKYIQSYIDTSKLAKLFYAIRAYIVFFFFVLFHKPDILHMHTSFGASFYRQIPFIYLARMRKIPIINHIHGPDFKAFYETASEKKKKKIRKIYNKCTLLITLSEDWKKNFLNVVPEDKIVVIENYGTAITDIELENRNYKQILFLGAINQRKGCDNIPEIIKNVVLKVPDATFVIAGDGELSKLKERLKELNVLDKCILPGWIRDEQKDYYLRTSGCFFLPSYEEGMPMAILDAMSYSLPIVSTNVGGIPRIVNSGVNGFLHSPNDLQNISDSLVELISDHLLCKKMGEQSLKIIEERYTLDIHFKKLFSVYKKVLEEKR